MSKDYTDEELLLELVENDFVVKIPPRKWEKVYFALKEKYADYTRYGLLEELAKAITLNRNLENAFEKACEYIANISGKCPLVDMTDTVKNHWKEYFLKEANINDC